MKRYTDSLDDLKTELMKDWRFRWAYYKSWPKYRALRYWIKLRGRVDDWFENNT